MTEQSDESDVLARLDRDHEQFARRGELSLFGDAAAEIRRLRALAVRICSEDHPERGAPCPECLEATIEVLDRLTPSVMIYTSKVLIPPGVPRAHACPGVQRCSVCSPGVSSD